MRSLMVILAVFLVPLGVWSWGKASPKIMKAASASAGIAMGDFDTFIFNGDDAAVKFNTEKYSTPEFEQLSISRQSLWDIDMAPEELETPSNKIYHPSPSKDVLNAIPYPENLNGNDGVIENYHYGIYTGEQYLNLDNGGQVRNCTELSNDMLYGESQKDFDFEIDPDSNEPQILIYHTHATESFELTEKNYYDSSFSCKTTDPEKSIIAVGNKICEQLDKAGIPYIHDTLVHDYPSYDGSYQSSRETVQDILEKYPSIKIALDIHRDGIEREDGTRLAPITEINGKQAAQIMIISGCDDGTMDMPNYLKNFHFASFLQSKLESSYSGLTRPILFDYRFYNQDLTTGSLLIEVGSHGNTLEQVKYTGELIGKSLCEIIKGN